MDFYQKSKMLVKKWLGQSESNQRSYKDRKKLTVETLEPRVMLAAAPVINEFLASNNTYLDGDGNDSDWIEIYNAGDASVNLGGWYLSDDSGELTKWPFPSVDLAAEDYLIIYASGQDEDDYIDAGGNLHTNLQLSSNGE